MPFGDGRLARASELVIAKDRASDAVIVRAPARALTNDWPPRIWPNISK